MNKIILFLIALPFFGYAQTNKAPQIGRMNVQVEPSIKRITITYDLTDAENDVSEVSVLVGKLFDQRNLVKILNATGDIGSNITVGDNKTITWNYDEAILFASSQYTLTLVADDGKVPTVEEILSNVDCERMMNDLKYLAKSPRNRNSNPLQLQNARDTIKKILTKEIGSVTIDTFKAGSITGRNLNSKLYGKVNGQKSIIIDAHYDSVNNAPGADDNGSGVVGVLEAARILGKYNFKKSLIFAAFDMEEDGLIGSKNYAKSLTSDDIAGVLNLEMIGFYTNQPNTQTMPTGFNQLFPQAYAAVIQDSFRGNFITNVGNVPSNALINAFNSAATKYVPDLKVISVALPGTGTIAPDFRRSDHASFWDRNINALMLTDGANFRNKNYHTEADTLGSVNKEFLCKVVKATIATAISLAELDHSGHQSYTNYTAVNDQINKGEIIISPNPARNSLSVQMINSEPADGSLEIFDSAGKKLHSENIDKSQSTFVVDISQLPAGAYVLRLGSVSKSFIKE